MSRSRSILLQVAFKEAVGASLGTDQNIKTVTKQFYNDLVALHDELGIEITDDRPSRGGGFSGARSSAPKKATPTSVLTFADSDGVQWQDWRAAKAGGDAIAKHPDFKTVDQSRGNGRSLWLFGQDGEPNPEAQELVAAADQMASLAAPMA